jgi:hypothetical protein
MKMRTELSDQLTGYMCVYGASYTLKRRCRGPLPGSKDNVLDPRSAEGPGNVVDVEAVRATIWDKHVLSG